MSVVLPEYVERALDAWAEELRGFLHRGDLIVVEWSDAADERQVVLVRREKVSTPVRTVGFFYDVMEGHIVLVSHIFSGKWKDMTYIPVGLVKKITIAGEGNKERLVSDKTWSGHAHTRKVRFDEKTRSVHTARARAILNEKKRE